MTQAMLRQNFDSFFVLCYSLRLLSALHIEVRESVGGENRGACPERIPERLSLQRWLLTMAFKALAHGLTLKVASTATSQFLGDNGKSVVLAHPDRPLLAVIIEVHQAEYSLVLDVWQALIGQTKLLLALI